jgi:nitroreductase
MDQYQEAYLLHQARKKEQLLSHKKDAFLYLAQSRTSHRKFSPKKIPASTLNLIKDSAKLPPTSCNRHATSIKLFTGKPVACLDSLLVGGRNWLQYAPHTILIFSDPKAYKAPNEINFMPFLDAGFLAMHLLYLLHSLDLSACFINPNIRPSDLPLFNSSFNQSSLIFSGAIAFGSPFLAPIS